MDLLEELNLALKTMDLPVHRKTVDRSGSNLVWLRKHASRQNDITPRIQDILNLDINQIVNGQI